jgi:hypothetical protein
MSVEHWWIDSDTRKQSMDYRWNDTDRKTVWSTAGLILTGENRVWIIGGMILTAETRNPRRQTYQCHTIYHESRTGRNPIEPEPLQ